MDSTKTVILPTMVFCTLVFIIYYRFYSRKSKKKQEQSQNQNQPEVKEKQKDDNIIQNKESEENEQREMEEKEEEEEPEEKEEEISNWKMTSNMLFDKFLFCSSYFWTLFFRSKISSSNRRNFPKLVVLSFSVFVSCEEFIKLVSS